MASAVCVGAVLLTGCGQKGNLYLPTEAASQGRASLPGSVVNTSSQTAQSTLRALTPRTATSAPVLEAQRDLPTDPSVDKSAKPSADRPTTLPSR
jgi:predicted small lipoprotein YifL